MKKTTPSTAMAKRFFPTMSHSRGERSLFSPENKDNDHMTSLTPSTSQSACVCAYVSVSVCECALGTKSFEGVGHRLVFHHVDESPPQTEVREDEEDVLQDIVDSANFLSTQV